MFFDKQAVTFIILQQLSTALAVGLCILASTWKLYLIDFVTMSTILFRGVTSIITTRYLVAPVQNASGAECIPMVLRLANIHVAVIAMLVEFVMFRVGKLTMSAAAFTCFICGFIEQLTSKITNSPQCEEKWYIKLLMFLTIAAIGMPFSWLLQLPTVDQLRLLDLNKQIRQQQS